MCQSGYTLFAGDSCGGVCKKGHTIDNCEKTAKSLTYPELPKHCFRCRRNYAMNGDKTECEYVCKDQRTENCVNYQTLADGSYVCNQCEDGFSLTNSYQCYEDCPIKNCANCVYSGADLKCLYCQNGYIGVMNTTTFFYDSCLNCKDWIKALNVNLAPAPAS